MDFHPIREVCGDYWELNVWRFFSGQVYLAAGAVYGLEGALGDLEHCARSISSGTTDTELAFLEDQVATAAAQVQQSELQVLEGLDAVDFHTRLECCIGLGF